MQTVETIKSKSQETFNNLLEKGKEQPEEVKTWGITAGGAVVGAVAVAAVAKGVVAVLATLASPPIALTVGAVGGGLFGWNWMKEKNASDSADGGVTPVVPPAAPAPVVAPSQPMEAAAV